MLAHTAGQIKQGEMTNSIEFNSTNKGSQALPAAPVFLASWPLSWGWLRGKSLCNEATGANEPDPTDEL